MQLTFASHSHPKVLARGVEAAEGQAEGTVADEDLGALPPAVDGRVGVEVVGPAGILAPRHVCDEVQRPVQEQSSLPWLASSGTMSLQLL